ncbi:MAG: amidohydrolase [Anaerolineae bacterium]|jgi:hypothetical protein
MGTSEDLLLVNGSIYPMDPHYSVASALVVREGRVLAVGGSELRDFAGSDVRPVDLEGRCVLPGLTDSHVHFAGFALGLQKVDLAGTRSLEDALARVAERAAETPPGEWIEGRGWDQERWLDRRFPSATDLDRVAPRHLVALTAKSGHVLVANALALKRADITASTPDPNGGRIERDGAGNPTGLLFEEAMELMRAAIPDPSAEEVIAVLPAAFERAWQVGLTGVHEMAVQGVPDRVVFDAYQRLRARAELRLRIVKYLPREMLDHALALGMRSGLGDDWLRVGGIKVFVDGALGSHTAAMLEPYVGEPSNLGILITGQERLEELIRRATAGGLALAMHAIGDRANRMVLEALTAARDAEGMTASDAPRHRIEHAQLLHPDDLGRVAELGAVASMQPVHAVQDAPMVDRYWGQRCTTAYAWRSLLDSGAVLAFGSDCPVEDMNPFLGIQAAATRVCPDGYGGSEGWHAEQRLTVEEAVRGYTSGAACAVGAEDRLGALAPGWWADLVVLDRDILTCDPAAIGETQVVGTMIEGRWVFGKWAA